MERENIQREEFVLSYDGPAIRDHEMDIEVLATSLLSLKSLIERTNTVLNGRNASVAVKVKAGFQEGHLKRKSLWNIWEWCCQSFPKRYKRFVN